MRLKSPRTFCHWITSFGWFLWGLHIISVSTPTAVFKMATSKVRWNHARTSVFVRASNLSKRWILSPMRSPGDWELVINPRLAPPQLSDYHLWWMIRILHVNITTLKLQELKLVDTSDFPRTKYYENHFLHLSLRADCGNWHGNWNWVYQHWNILPSASSTYSRNNSLRLWSSKTFQDLPTIVIDYEMSCKWPKAEWKATMTQAKYAWSPLKSVNSDEVQSWLNKRFF